MIRSMTGFGEASTERDGVHYSIEVRSLNGKYFKSTIRLPDELQGLEPELEATMRRRLTRGTVTLIGRCTDATDSAAQAINSQALARYLDQIREAQRSSDGDDLQINIGTILTLPGVLQPDVDDEARLAQAREVFGALLERAIEQLLEMRGKEGALLLDDLRSQARVIGERLAEIRERTPDVVKEYEERLRARINSMLEDAGLQVEAGDLIREIAVFAERSDIAEEVTRLSGHMQQFEELLQNEESRSIGRTLDFVAQEMLREANTIASKSSDVPIARAIVEVKSAIDRIKEQVQNVE
ncbi:MAG: YicC/YloC family endoribonuclease [Phycisphaerales bacterium JB043]